MIRIGLLHRAVVLASLVSASITAADENRLPLNVVFILADDLGCRDLGCYGSTFHETPAIDELAREGVRFTTAYAACPVCSPTRASILTGRYPQRTGVTDWIGAPQPAAWNRNTPHLPAAYAEKLALGEQTLAERLKARGYATFFGGKWHLGGEGFMPEDQGFDVNFAGGGNGMPFGPGKFFTPYGLPNLSDGPPGEHLCERLASEAATFIGDHTSKPFLVYLPLYSVHIPLMTRPALQEKYEAKRNGLASKDRFGTEPPRRVRLTQDHAVYAGMVETFDNAVRTVLDAIDRHGLADRTLVILTSDNGGVSTSEGWPTSNGPFRAGKGWLYEGGIRVPAIARLPGRIPAGAVSDVPITSPDWLPTILAAAGLPPADGVDGANLWPTMTSEAEKPSPRPLFWHYPHYGNQGGEPGAAIRDGDWKLIEWFHDGRFELFHLLDDPGETTDLAVREPERAAALRERLHAWQREVGAVATTPNPAYDPAGPDGRGDDAPRATSRAEENPTAGRDVALRERIQTAVDRVYPALVRIDVVTESGGSGRMQKARGTGSGAIISSDGYIVTNHHVAGRGSRITIRMSDREELPATLVGTDPLSDLTVLKFDPGARRDPAAPLPFASFGDSDTLQIGDVVLAMGSPAGLSQSVTQGIVSNLALIPPGGAFRIEGESVGELVRWIGHDAIIFPGNSGGPLVNLAGEIVGVNEIGVGSLGGAIPATIAKAVTEEIIATGGVARSWVGMGVQPLLKSLAADEGVVVGSVLPGGPAEQAGIRPGDLITSFHGTPIPAVRSPEDLPDFNRLVFGLPVGTAVTVTGRRDGSPREWTITTAVREPSRPKEVELQPLGLTARDITKVVALERKRPTTAGSLVVGVRNGGGAAEAKPALLGGDIITRLGTRPIARTADLVEAVNAISGQSKEPTPTLVTFVRDAEELIAVVKVGPPSESDRVGRPLRPWLGAQTQVLTREIADALGVAGKQGVRVTHVVPESPAARAGLAVGDLLLKLDGRVIPANSPTDTEVFDNLVRQYAVGAEIAFDGLRGGEPLAAKATLVAAPAATGDLDTFKDETFELTVRELPLAERLAEQLPVDAPGVRVTTVQPNGWAALAGIGPGDIIVSIEGQVVRTVADAEQLLTGFRETKPKQVVFFVRRGVGTGFAEVEPRW
jgi:S1-C subfamily serine protease/arylsulfatase A-like enzyme